MSIEEKRPIVSGTFQIETQVGLHDTDAAGIVFFGNHFRMAHSAYEAFMQSIGCGLNKIIGESSYLLPIVHAEAYYKHPLHLGDRITISVKSEPGETSFVLSYLFTDAHGKVAAQLKTAHVSVDTKTGKKISLPDKLRQGLLSIC